MFEFSTIAILDVSVDTLIGAEIVVMVATVIVVEFIVAVACTVELLTEVWSDVGVASGIGAEASICALAAVMGVLEFAFFELLLPLKLVFLCCWASCNCWIMTAFDCDCASQACKPSDQV